MRTSVNLGPLRNNMSRFTRQGVTTIAVLLTVLLLLLLSGCTTYATRDARNAEYAWLALDAVDTAQTVTIARSPECLYEADPLAVFVYGTEHPSTGRVLMTNAVLAYGHYQLGGWIDRHTERAFAQESPARGGWYVTRAAFYVVSFLSTGIAVTNNAAMGIHPFSRVRC